MPEGFLVATKVDPDSTGDFSGRRVHASVRESRERLGLAGAGPRKVITDLGVLEPDPGTCELTLTGVYPGVSVPNVRAKTGWDLAVSASLDVLEPPTAAQLTALRQLQAAAPGSEGAA